MLIEINKLIYRKVSSSLETGLTRWLELLPPIWVRRCQRLAPFGQCFILGLCAVLAWIPNAAYAQDKELPSYIPPDDPTSTTVDLLQQVSDATSSFDTIWDTFLTNDSPFFGVVLNSTQNIVVVCFLFWALSSVWDWVQTNYEKFPWQRLFMPALIIFLYANNGQLTIIALQAYKHLVYEANSAILSGTYNGTIGLDLVQQANIQQGLREAYQQKIKSCEGKSEEEKVKCQEEVEAEIKAAGNQIQKKDSGFSFDVGKAVTESLQFVAFTLLIGFLTFMAGAFHLIMAYMIAVWASSAPIWVALGMFPAGRSSLQVFLSGLFAAMLSVWLYTILQIALASQMNTGLGFHGLLYPFLGGLVNPLIALFAGSMGFSSIMAASGVVSGAAVKIFSRGKA